MSKKLSQSESQTQSQREGRMFQSLSEREGRMFQSLSEREGRMLSFPMALHEIIKVVIASVSSVVFLAFAGLTLAGSTVALIVTTPLFILFSPILVPATIATTLLATGLTSGVTLGVTGMGLIMWLIKTAVGISSARLAKTPLEMLKISGGYGGSWGGKTFSGTFGDKPAGGATPAADGSKPAGGFGGFWGGTNIPDWLKNQPWFKNIPTGGATPATGATPTPPGGATPPPPGGSTPPVGSAPTE